jgi:hypothetical protein
MAIYYLRSLAAGTGTGADWANAYTTLTTALSGKTGADTIYVADDHAETGITGAIAFPSTSSGLRLLCVGTHTVNPPTVTEGLASTATCAHSANMTVTGSAHIHGVTFSAATGIIFGSNAGNFSVLTTKDVTLTPGGTGYTIGTNSANSGELTRLDNISLGSTFNHSVTIFGVAVINGGSITGSSATVTVLFRKSPDRTTSNLQVNGFDASNAATSVSLIDLDASGSGMASFRNCKLPASWSGSLVSGTYYPGSRISMYNCDSTDTNYRLWVEDYYGSVKDETTIVRTGGAAGGQTSGATTLSAFAWKVASKSTAFYVQGAFATDEIVAWVDTVGSALTATVEVVTDGVTLTDADCWLEIQYLGTSGVPLALFANDAAANILTAPVNQTSSSETWTTTGLTTPVKQKLSVTFTPQEKGFIHAVVKLTKASTTVYVDPKLTVA